MTHGDATKHSRDTSCSFHTFKYKQVRCIRYISGSQTGNTYFGLPPFYVYTATLNAHTVFMLIELCFFSQKRFVTAMGGTQLKTFTRGGGNLVDKGYRGGALLYTSPAHRSYLKSMSVTSLNRSGFLGLKKPLVIWSITRRSSGFLL